MVGISRNIFFLLDVSWPPLLTRCIQETRIFSFTANLVINFAFEVVNDVSNRLYESDAVRSEYCVRRGPFDTLGAISPHVVCFMQSSWWWVQDASHVDARQESLR